jgi:hypothetical protein
MKKNSKIIKWRARKVWETKWNPTTEGKNNLLRSGDARTENWNAVLLRPSQWMCENSTWRWCGDVTWWRSCCIWGCLRSPSPLRMASLSRRWEPCTRIVPCGLASLETVHRVWMGLWNVEVGSRRPPVSCSDCWTLGGRQLPCAWRSRKTDLTEREKPDMQKSCPTP